MFSGIGAPEEAQRRYNLDYKFVGACEIDKFARSIYRYQHKPKWEIDHDATKLRPERMPDFDLLVFGWPCQDNSIAGQRAGQKEGTRSGLLSIAAEVLRHKKPDYFIAENVPGLYSVNRGLDFIDSLGLLSDVGYDVQWQSLDTRWMLPQSRERVYLVGHLRGKSRPQVFPIGESDIGTSKGSTNSATVRALTAGGHSGGHHSGMTLIQKKDGTGGNKRIGGWVETDKRIFAFQNDGKRSTVQEHIYHKPTDITDSLSTAHVPKVTVEAPRACLTPDRAKKRQNGRRLKDENEPMFTLTKQDIHGVAHKGGIRRLTPMECERLQGFPDRFTAWGVGDTGHGTYVSDSQRYKAIGNAMTVDIVGLVMQKLQDSTA